MTSLTITPELAKKSAKLVGKVAAGEHVSVTIEGAADLASSSLYLRVMYGPCTIAQFPQPVDEGETAEVWGESGDGLTCTLNLNTIQALKYCLGPDTDCLFVLEEIGTASGTEPTLYFTKNHRIGGWPQKRLTDEPFNLDAYPGLIEEWTRQLANISASVTKVGNTATISITDKNGNITTASVTDGQKGDIGDTGVGVQSVTYVGKDSSGGNVYCITLTNGVSYNFTAPKGDDGEDGDVRTIFDGTTFARPTAARGWYDLLAYVVHSLGGDIQVDGITPGTAPTTINMTAGDGTVKSLRIVKVGSEYTTEVF